MTRRNDKRQRLIDAADTLFHQQGVSITTLADIASLAEIPLGNVYYYFKSKDSIITSVVERRRQELLALLADITSKTSDPAERVALYVQHIGSTLDTLISYGDHMGSLCQELSKERTPTHAEPSILVRDMLQWLTTQFEALGKTPADLHAQGFLSSLFGISLLTFTLKNSDLFHTQTKRLLAQYTQQAVMA